MSLFLARRKPLFTAALALGAMTILLPLPAAAAPQQGRGPHGRGPQAQAGGTIDQELAETLQQLMILRLKRALELTPDQEETVVPLMQDLTQRRRQDQQLRMEGLRTLSALSKDSAASEDLMRERLDAFYSDQAAARRAEMEILTALRAELTPRQEARLLAFEERFRSDIRNRMQDARRQRERARPRMDRPDPQRP